MTAPLTSDSLTSYSAKIPLDEKLSSAYCLLPFWRLVCPAVAAADADRDVALWALRMGGASCWKAIRGPFATSPQLPAADFRIVVLNMIGANMHPPHMEAFGETDGASRVALARPMWNPRAESRTEYSEEIGHLAGLTTLKKLTFGYTFLETIRFYDVGLDKIQSLGPTLEELVLRRARMKGAGLEHFTNLRSLDITWTRSRTRA